MTYTKGDIKRLGERILKNNGEINSDDLILLQGFRTSFSKPLTSTFTEIIQIKNKVRQSAIVAFRLKRISTIINKVIRVPDMNLSRMGDIAGIRLIFENEREVYKALEYIQNQFEQSGKIRDYIKNPKKIGYRSIHIYIKDKNLGKRIEIQIRTTSHHNWSTLVEISDLMYNDRLKELGYDSNPRVAEFHSLMSSDKELTDNEADLVYSVLESNNFITKLGDLFRKNNSLVRKQWSSLDKNSRYFLIEASKETTPKLKAFKNYNHAEREYFETYKKNQHAEIVLTAISTPSFQQICIAYANYILSYHTFIKDVEPIIKNLALRALEEKDIKKFKRIFETYEQLQANFILNVFFEIAELTGAEFSEGKIILKSGQITKSKLNSIQLRFKEKISKRTKLHKDFVEEIEINIPYGFLRKRRCMQFLKKHQNRIEKLIKSQDVFIERSNP